MPVSASVSRRFQRGLHHRRIGDQRDVRARLRDPRPADRRQFGTLRKFLFHRVQALVLDEQHRLAEPDRALQQAIGLGGREGATTTRPGTWMNQASRLCECCAAAPPAAPACVRTTRGTASWPPDM